jgi:hypothetical protein
MKSFPNNCTWCARSSEGAFGTCRSSDDSLALMKAFRN